MGSIPNIREKYLLVKEKWPIVLTGIAGVWYRRVSGAAVVYPLRRHQSFGAGVRVGVVVVLGSD
jgi:hypothetical protein